MGHKKIIDDDVLLGMIREGKRQNEIAKSFGVSAVAICKRLKRLLPQPDLDKYNLTDQQKRFVAEKVKGKTNTQAALASYEVGSMQSAKVIGSNLMDNPKVKMAIEELMEHHGLTRSYRIQKLKNHVDHRDPTVSLKALDVSFRLDNSYPQAASININTDTKVSLLDLSAYVYKPEDNRESKK